LRADLPLTVTSTAAACFGQTNLSRRPANNGKSEGSSPSGAINGPQACMRLILTDRNHDADHTPRHLAFFEIAAVEILNGGQAFFNPKGAFSIEPLGLHSVEPIIQNPLQT
jgi:hypothetical protein